MPRHQHCCRQQRQYPQAVDTQHRADGQEHDKHNEQHTDNTQRDQRQAEAALLGPQHRVLGRMGVEHRPDEHGDAQVYGAQRHRLADPRRRRERLLQQRQQQHIAQTDDAQHQHAVEHCSLYIAAQERRPVAVLLLSRLLRVRIAVQLLHQLFRQQLFDAVADAVGALDKEWRGQRGNDGYGDDDGIDIVRDHAQRQTQRRDDKRKFADLRQRAAAVDGLPQCVAGQQHTQRGEDQLAHDGHQRQNKNGDGVLHHGAGVQHHTHRDEEHRAEQVLDAGGQMLHPLGVDGACQQRACQKRAQRRGKAQRIRQQHHAEADAQ